MEKTTAPLAELKFDAGEGMTFSGYGAVFGNRDAHGDVIEPGAFKKTLRAARGKGGQWPAMLLQHGSMLGGDDDMPIGVWTELSEDDTGLYVEGKLAETARGRDAYTLLKMTPRPAITGMSIGYRARKFTHGTKPDEPRRKLEEIDLLEVSLVTFPANEKARVQAVKSLADMTALDWREIEGVLRDAGLSRALSAKAVATFKDWLQCDAAASNPDGPRDEGAAELAELIGRNIATLKRS